MGMYRIKDWDGHFENDRSRRVDECSFVCVPNKQHGLGLLYILSLEDGLTVYAIWNLILGAASRQRKPRQGWMSDDGTEAGIPWTHEEMALRWRRSIKEIETAIQVLCSSRVGWLENATHQSFTTNPDLMAVEGMKEGTNEGRKEVTSTADKPQVLAADLSPVVIEFLTKPGKRNKATTWALREDFLKELQTGFPHVGVRVECQKARTLVGCSSETLHTADGMRRFLFDWMARADRWRLSGRAAVGSRFAPALNTVDPETKRRQAIEQAERNQRRIEDQKHGEAVAKTITSLPRETIDELTQKWVESMPIEPKNRTLENPALREFIFAEFKKQNANQTTTKAGAA